MAPRPKPLITQKQFARYAADPAAFRDDLIVDVDGVCRRLGDVMDDWQRDDFAALDPALKRCNGRSDESAKMRAYFERPRGHSKTTDLAVVCCWALAFATRPIRGYCFAADKDQAALLKDAMAVVVRLNPWLGQLLDVQKSCVVNIGDGHPGNGGKLDISTSDVASSFGILPDLIIADELTHWQGDGSLWHSLISSAAKRSNCLLVTISNAGFCDSWQWSVREAARSDEDNWIFSRLEGPQASWMTEARLEEMRRMLPAIAFARLFENLWSSSGGDALSEEVINAAFVPDLGPLTRAEKGYMYTGGLDLGVSRDCSAIVILGVKRGRFEHGKIRLAYTRIWRPTKKKKVNLQQVEDAIADLYQRFKFKQFAYDPWEARHMASRLQSAGMGKFAGETRFGKQRRERMPLIEVAPTGTNLQNIATAVIESFNDHRLELYDDGELKRDLHRLRVEERPYGFRLTSPRDGSGHGDTASAFSLALLAAAELASKKIVRAGAVSDRDPDDDDEEERPADLREMEQLRDEHNVNVHNEGAIKAMLGMGGYRRLAGLYPHEAGGRL